SQGVTPTGGALRDALTKSLADNNMPATQVQVVGSAVQFQLKNVSFPEWTVWLDDVRKQYKVQVNEAHITAQKPDGQVDLTASLQPAQGQ
ncbi:type II secretion system protein GspM, partial [Caballeronia sp. M23-90]